MLKSLSVNVSKESGPTKVGLCQNRAARQASPFKFNLLNPFLSIAPDRPFSYSVPDRRIRHGPNKRPLRVEKLATKCHFFGLFKRIDILAQFGLEAKYFRLA
jgi:hypothetical protein